MRLRDTAIEQDSGAFVFPSPKPIKSNSAVEIYFDNFVNVLCAEIRKHDVIVGCVAWLTEKTILTALQGKNVSFVVTKQDWLRPDLGSKNPRKDLLPYYAKLKNDFCRYWLPDPLPEMSFAGDPTFDSVRCVGEAKSTYPLLCHHKFAVFGKWIVSNDKPPVVQPTAVWTGSFNWTVSGGNNLENAVILRDSVVAEAYFQEWARALAISEPLDWEHQYVAPEWRIGS